MKAPFTFIGKRSLSLYTLAFYLLIGVCHVKAQKLYASKTSDVFSTERQSLIEVNNFRKLVQYLKYERGVYISYSLKDIDPEKRIELENLDRSSEELLKQALLKVLPKEYSFKIVRQGENYLIRVESDDRQQTKGSIKGKVLDEMDSREVLIGATVRIEGTSRGAVVDVNGEFEIKGLDPGNYTLVVSYVGYKNQRIENIEVKSRGVTSLNIQMQIDRKQLNEIVVETERVVETTEGMISEERTALNIIEGISVEQIADFGDFNVATALRRIPGITLLDGKTITVRGLNDRYNQYLINGMQIPALDPDGNTVQLDIFPADLISGITVTKSFRPDLPGNFTGGLVDIRTSRIPDEKTISVSGRIGFNTNTTFTNDFLSQARSNTDWLGFDNGLRDVSERGINYGCRDCLPSREAIAVRNPDPEIAAAAREATLAFPNTMDPVLRTAPPDHRFSFTIGNKLDVGDTKIGYRGGLTYGRQFRTRTDGINVRYDAIPEDFEEFIPRQAGGTIIPQTFLLFDQSVEEILWGSLFSTEVLFSKNQKIGGTVMYNQGAEFSSYEGGGEYDERVGTYAETASIFYTQRNLRSFQLYGDHTFLPNIGLQVSWAGAITESSIDQPDLRFFAHYDGEVDLFEFVETRNRPDTVTDGVIRASDDFDPIRIFRFQNQIDHNAKIDVSIPQQFFEREANLKAGAFFLNRDRDYRENEYFYDSSVPTFSGRRSDYIENLRLNIREDYVFDPDNSPNSIEGVSIQDNYRSRNNYVADQQIRAAYLMADFKPHKDLNIVAGVRIEDTEMRFTSDAWDDRFLQGPDTVLRTLNDTLLLDATDILPSINLTYALNKNMQIRAGYNRTLARPSFREKAPIATFDFVGDAVAEGNLGLNISYIQNLDLRYEYYPRQGELYSLGLFTKFFDDAIERVYIPRPGMADRITWENVEDAELYGIELEARKNLDFLEGFLFNNFWERLTFGGNVSFIYSNVEDITDGNTEDSLSFTRTRPLFGQPPYLINTFLNYTSDKLEVNTNFNVQGRFLVLTLERSDESSQLPNVFQFPQPELDVNILYKFTENFSMRFSANNLLNPFHALQYDVESDLDLYYDRYRIGRTFSISAAFNLNAFSIN